MTGNRKRNGKRFSGNGNEMPSQRSETETEREETVMTIQDVADRLGVSKKKVWTAVKSGQIEAEKTKRGKAWRYSISEDAAESYRLSLDDSRDWKPVLEGAETGNETRNVSQETETQRNETETKQRETAGNDGDTIKELFNRLEMSHRKQVYLEMQLQQTQRLLCENNESQHEREARALEAEAKSKEEEALREQAELEAKQAQEEALRAQSELEELKSVADEKKQAEEALELMAADLAKLKTEISAKESAWVEERKRPWWKKMFGRKSS